MFGPWETWQEAATFFAVIVVLYIAVMWAAAVFWTARDIRSRHNSGTVQLASAGLVAVFFLPGLWIYRIMRPTYTLADQYERSLQAEAVMFELSQKVECPTCRRRVRDEFLVCPSCRTTLKESCSSCGRPVAYAWAACPYCGRDRQAAAVARALREPAPQPAPVGASTPRPALKEQAPEAVPVAAPTPRPALEPEPARLRAQRTAPQRPPSRDPFVVSRERANSPGS